MSLGDWDLCPKLATLKSQALFSFFLLNIILGLMDKRIMNKSKKRAVVNDTLGHDHQKTCLFFQKTSGIRVFIEQQWFYLFVYLWEWHKTKE